MTKSLGYFEDDPLLPDIRVDSHEDEFTGILDSDGNKIYKHRQPIGFGRDKERSYFKYRN